VGWGDTTFYATVLSKMKETVAERCKEASEAGCSPPLRPLDVAKVVREVTAALTFLHDLKDGAGQTRAYCHNDVNPWIIMLSQNVEAVLVDFDSCKRLGTPHDKGTARGWGDGGPRSTKENDFAGLTRVALFMRAAFKDGI